MDRGQGSNTNHLKSYGHFEECFYLKNSVKVSSKIFLMYIIMTRTPWPNVEYLKTSEILKVSSDFDICSFVQISRNAGLLQVEKCVIFWEISHLQLRKFSIVCIMLSSAHIKSFILFFFMPTGGTKMNAS